MNGNVRLTLLAHLLGKTGYALLLIVGGAGAGLFLAAAAITIGRAFG